MNRQLSITLVTESEYKNYIDKYEIQTTPPSVLIQGIDISYLYISLKTVFTCMYYSTGLPKEKGSS